MATVRIAGADVCEHGGALRSEAASATARWTQRRGLRLTVRDDGGTEGEGEASPLPGYSSEGLDRARAVLGTVSWGRLPAFELDAPVAPQIREALRLLHPGSPSARFAVETALLDLLGKRVGRPVHRLLAPERPPAAVPLAALLPGGDGDRTVREAEGLASRGVAALKIKIGREVERELAVLRRVRAAVGPEVELRADANRTLGAHRLDEALGVLRELGVALLEEPAPPALLEGLAAPEVPFAADESLHDPTDREHVRALTRRGIYRAWVLKPTALGGAHSCLELAHEGRALGVDVIASHLFEGPVALAAAAELALALGGGRAAGLAPHAGLGAWPARRIAALGSQRIVPHDRPGLGLMEAR